MDYYIDIRVLLSPDFSDCILMNELYQRLHKVLVGYGRGEVGVSFPQFKKTLGGHLRLHGNQLSLQRLMAESWIDGFNDYVVVSDITSIPESTSHRIVKRVQCKSSAERLRRRSVQKGWLTKEEANLIIADGREKTLSLPYLKLRSQSTQQFFRLFIEHGPVVTQPITGKFSTYGLSSIVTIPWF